MTEYVLQKAPCRVLLTAPPDDKVEPPAGRIRSIRPDVRPDRRLRAGRLVGRADDAPRGARGLLPGRGPGGARAPRGRAWIARGRTPAVSSPSARPSRRTRCWRRGSSAPTRSSPSTDGDNTNIVIAQIAKRRFNVPTVIARILDPLRAEWYEKQGVNTICPTRVAIEMLENEVLEAAGVRARLMGERQVHDHRRRRQGGLEPGARVARQGPRGDPDREQPRPLHRRSSRSSSTTSSTATRPSCGCWSGPGSRAPTW